MQNQNVRGLGNGSYRIEVLQGIIGKAREQAGEGGKPLEGVFQLSRA